MNRTKIAKNNLIVHKRENLKKFTQTTKPSLKRDLNLVFKKVITNVCSYTIANMCFGVRMK